MTNVLFISCKLYVLGSFTIIVFTSIEASQVIGQLPGEFSVQAVVTLFKIFIKLDHQVLGSGLKPDRLDCRSFAFAQEIKCGLLTTIRCCVVQFI